MGNSRAKQKSEKTPMPKHMYLYILAFLLVCVCVSAMRASASVFAFVSHFPVAQPLSTTSAVAASESFVVMDIRHDAECYGKE